MIIYLVIMWCTTHLHVIAVHSPLRSLAIFLTYGHACHAGRAANSSLVSACAFLQKKTVPGNADFPPQLVEKCRHDQAGKCNQRCVVSPWGAFPLRIYQRHFKSTHRNRRDAHYFNTHHLHSALVFFQSSHHRIHYLPESTRAPAPGVGRETLKNIFYHIRIEQRPGSFEFNTGKQFFNNSERFFHLHL